MAHKTLSVQQLPPQLQQVYYPRHLFYTSCIPYVDALLATAPYADRLTFISDHGLIVSFQLGNTIM